MTPSMSNVLGQYFLFMRRTMVFSEITHIPGHQNAQADALSRFETPHPPVDPKTQVAISWQDLLRQDGVRVSQHKAKWPATFRVRLT